MFAEKALLYTQFTAEQFYSEHEAESAPSQTTEYSCLQYDLTDTAQTYMKCMFVHLVSK